MFTTHIEKFFDNLDELKVIFSIHADELSEHIKHGFDLNPDYKKYESLERGGQLLFIALREEGKLVGYFTGVLQNSLHYSCLSLSLDLFYVLPEYRGDWAGEKAGQILLNAVKKEAIRRNVGPWTMGRKVARGKHMEKLLLDAGFKPFEIHYVMWLNET